MIYFFSSVAFFAGFAFVAGVNFLIADISVEKRRRLAEKAKEDARLRNAEKARREIDAKLAQRRAFSNLAQYQEKKSLWTRWKLVVQQSGITGIKAETLMVLAIGLGFLSGGASAYFFVNISLGVLFGVGACSLPFLYVYQRRKTRQIKLLSQLPDAYEMLSRILRSGHTVTNGFKIISEEFDSPLAEEFAYCWDQQNLGLSTEASLKDLAKRIELLEISIFVAAVSINNTTGGNLAHLLSKLSEVIRERENMKSKMIAITTEGRLQAYFLIALPFGLAGIMSVVNPTYLSPLLQYKSVIVGTILWMGVGFLWMKRIMNFDI